MTVTLGLLANHTHDTLDDAPVRLHVKSKNIAKMLLLYTLKECDTAIPSKPTEIVVPVLVTVTRLNDAL